jgi:hypothetical protein
VAELSGLVTSLHLNCRLHFGKADDVDNCFMQIQRDQLVYFEACVNEKALIDVPSFSTKELLFFWHV